MMQNDLEMTQIDVRQYGDYSMNHSENDENDVRITINDIMCQKSNNINISNIISVPTEKLSDAKNHYDITENGFGEKLASTVLLDERIQSLAEDLKFGTPNINTNTIIINTQNVIEPTVLKVEKTIITPPSDEDSACADIDRWASSSLGDSSSQINESAKVRELEMEHERLNESVLALSTHFAHIQFRIQQISAAPSEQRDKMLRELQEFASKGCVDLGQFRRDAEKVTRIDSPPSIPYATSFPQQASLESDATKIDESKSNVVALIEKLRAQLDELERFAYESGQHGELPISELKRRQKLVFDKLQEKIRLKIELDKLSGEEFQKNIEQGIEQVLEPLREKDQLVDQLQTQIVDLERFVALLQNECAQLASPHAAGDALFAFPFTADGEDANLGALQKLSTSSALPDLWVKTSMANYAVSQKRSMAALIGRSVSVESTDSQQHSKSQPQSPSAATPSHAAALAGGGQHGGIRAMSSTRYATGPPPPASMQRSLSCMNSHNAYAQGFSATSSSAIPPHHHPSWLQRWLGCKSAKRFEKNELKRTALCNHYGDQRARMELAVHAVVEVMRKHQILSVDRSEREALPIERLNESIIECSDEAIVSVIRKEFSTALKDLLEHGLRDAVAANSALHGDGGGGELGLPTLPVVSFLGCASRHSSTYANRMNIALKKFDAQKLEHVWDVVNLFYECSRALEMRDAAIGRLSDAFKLETVEGRSATSKQVLLATVENVRSTHSRLQRSRDTMWKAFVSAALNYDRLPGWIRIIFRSSFILKKCYNTWAYVARTGCEDIRPLLESLHEFNFDLPVDLAVRPFEHIKEAF